MSDRISQSLRPMITAIIPAYNEGNNIGEVLDVLHGVDNINEIILVDDGSTDNTIDIMRQAAQVDQRICVLTHDKNRGKGEAIFTAWSITNTKYILLLDADLKILKPEHIQDLSTPVLDYRADMTLGLFWGGHLTTDLSSRATPWLTGQRCLRSNLLKYVSREAAQGYGFEIALTIAAHQIGYRSRIVTLRGVWHPPSEFHRGLWFGTRWRARMYAQIIRALYIANKQRYRNAKVFFHPF